MNAPQKKTQLMLQCNLKQYMEMHGISALKLSETLDIRRATLNDLINNNDMEIRRIPVNLIVKVCEYFELDIEDLFSFVRVDEDGNIIEKNVKFNTK